VRAPGTSRALAYDRAVPGFLRRDRIEPSVEDEREALRRQRVTMAEELERLKRELSQRVAAVRDKEHQLDEALGRAGQASTVAASSNHRGRDLDAREAALAERERALAAREALPPPEPPEPPAPTADELARIEARLAELRDAEHAFLRTQEELAARSEAVAARERLVADREREVDELEDRAGLGPTRSELSELESRLRRLESQGTVPSEDTQSFAAGLEGLRRRGTKRPTG
jgi:DNA repair exonuclease SbcCD ATPase subunit